MAKESRLVSTIYLESPGFRASPIVRAGSLLPAVGWITLSTTGEGQASIDLALNYGGPSGAEASRPIGQWQVFGVALLGQRPKVLVQVQVEVSGEVRVSATHEDKKLDLFLLRSKKPVPVEELETADEPLSAAREWLALGDRGGAAIELSRVLAGDPSNLPAWELLATLLVDRSKQIDCYRQILRLDPNHRQAAAQLRVLTGPPEESTPAAIAPAQDAAELAEAELSEAQLAPSLEMPEEALTELAPASDMFEEESEADRFLRSLEGDAGQTGVQDLPAELTPEDIVRLAGEPLSAEKRRRCPQCDAVISQEERRCPWCSAPLDSESSE